MQQNTELVIIHTQASAKVSSK